MTDGIGMISLGIGITTVGIRFRAIAPEIKTVGKGSPEAGIPEIPIDPRRRRGSIR
jgi:hypothetical protein